MEEHFRAAVRRTAAMASAGTGAASLADVRALTQDGGKTFTRLAFTVRGWQSPDGGGGFHPLAVGLCGLVRAAAGGWHTTTLGAEGLLYTWACHAGGRHLATEAASSPAQDFHELRLADGQAGTLAGLGDYRVSVVHGLATVSLGRLALSEAQVDTLLALASLAEADSRAPVLFLAR